MLAKGGGGGMVGWGGGGEYCWNAYSGQMLDNLHDSF